MCCPLVFEFSVGIGGFVIGLGQISFFFSLCMLLPIATTLVSFELFLHPCLASVIISIPDRSS